MDNAVLGPLLKLMMFIMIKNTDFNVSVDTTPYKFRHYDISEFSLYVNGMRVPNEGLSPDMDHENRLSCSIGHCLKGLAFITRTRVYK